MKLNGSLMFVQTKMKKKIYDNFIFMSIKDVVSSSRPFWKLISRFFL